MTGTDLNGFVVAIPAEMPTGLADVTRILDGTEDPPFTINVVHQTLGLFAASGWGVGSAIAQNTKPGAIPVPNLFTYPARPGEYVTLVATGLDGLTTQAVRVELAGRQIPSTYAGPAPGFLGLDQVDFRVPEDVPEGCYLSVRIVTGDDFSNEVTIAKADQGNCPHPLGLSADNLATIDQASSPLAGPMIPFGWIRFLSDIGALSPENVRSEWVFGGIFGHSPQGLFLIAEPQESDDLYFSCRLTPDYVIGSAFDEMDPWPAYDAGSNLHAEFQDGSGFDIPGSPDGSYGISFDDGEANASSQDIPARRLKAGSWTLTGPGGRTIEKFQFNFTLPPPAHWTNPEPPAVLSRNQDIPITWDPQGYGSQEVVVVTISDPFKYYPRPGQIGGIVCRAPAKRGQVILPRSLLQQLSSTRSALLKLQLAPQPSKRTLVSLPLLGGGSLPFLVDYSLTENKWVSIE